MMSKEEVLNKSNPTTEALAAVMGMEDNSVEKAAYVPPTTNYNILDQNFGRGLNIDEGNTFVDLVVGQSELLNMVNIDRVSTLKSTVNVYEGDGMLVQVNEGEDPFAASGNMASYGNIGYDVVLESMQFLYRIPKSVLHSMKNAVDWRNDVNSRMSRLFSNMLIKQAMFGSPGSGADADIQYGYNYTGTALMGRPRNGVRGWLDYLKKGYTYSKGGNSYTATVGGVATTISSGNGSSVVFKSITDIVEDLVKVYPAEHDGEDVVIMMSKADFLDFMFSVAKKDASTMKYETGRVYSVAGYNIMILPFLHHVRKTITAKPAGGSETTYYPGMVLMGRPKDLIIKMNTAGINFDSEYYAKLRTYDSIYDVPLAFPVIPQRFAIAHKV